MNKYWMSMFLIVSTLHNMVCGMGDEREYQRAKSALGRVVCNKSKREYRACMSCLGKPECGREYTNYARLIRQIAVRINTMGHMEQRDFFNGMIVSMEKE